MNLYLQEVRKKSPALRAAEAVEPSNPAAAVEDRDYLRRALAALPPKQRTALVLRYYLDLNDVEISRVMDCRRTTVRSHVRRRIRALQSAQDPTEETS